MFISFLQAYFIAKVRISKSYSSVRPFNLRNVVKNIGQFTEDDSVDYRRGFVVRRCGKRTSLYKTLQHLLNLRRTICAPYTSWNMMKMRDSFRLASAIPSRTTQWTLGCNLTVTK